MWGEGHGPNLPISAFTIFARYGKCLHVEKLEIVWFRMVKSFELLCLLSVILNYYEKISLALFKNIMLLFENLV